MINATKKTCLIALLGLMGGFFFIASAQEHGWNKTYLADRPVLLFSSVAADSNGFKVIGSTYGHWQNLGKGFMGKIDMHGDLENYLLPQDSVFEETGLFANTLIKTESGGFAFAGYSDDSLTYMLLGLANTTFDTVKTHRYYSPNTYAYLPWDMLQIGNYLYITGVKTNIGSDPNVFLMEVDSDGTQLWLKEYGLVNWQERARSLTQLTNGNLLIGAERINVDLNPQRANTWLIEVDTAGSIIRQWLDNTDSTYAAYGLKQTADGGFVYGCQKKFEQHTSTITYTGNITKLNSNFTKQWVFNDGYLSIYNGVSDIELLSNGDIIACGQKRSEFEDTTVSYGWVVKFDPVGNIYWNRVYSGVNTPNTKNYLRDIDILPDGSMIAVGECDPRSGSSPQLGWFLRLDANGCELENCTWGTPNAVAEITNNQQIHIYPNPANTTINILLPADMLGARVQIHNVVGQTVWLQKTHEEYTQPDISSFQKGIYIVSAVKGNRHLQAKLVVD